jgi:DNA-binding NtrC family response regulator
MPILTVIEMPASPLSNELLSLLNAYRDPAVVFGRDYRVIAANSAYLRIYGPQVKLGEAHCYELSHDYQMPCDRVGELCPMQESLRSGQPRRVLHIHHTPQGKEHVDVELYPIKEEDGEIHYFLEVMRQARVASARPEAPGLVGQSPAFLRMLEKVQRVATRDITVLLQGETGTGKELVAQALHQASDRAREPFVTVECSGLTETLFESELFGHEKGAFTGAMSRKAGLVAVAEGGTLFLDEIGEVPMNLQVKLLRLLETGTYRPVGSVESQRTDFRLVCATHRDLEAMVEHGEFREDLYYRISAFPIHLPAIRERREDIPLLVETLLSRLDKGHALNLHPDTLACLQDYHYPGNIRQLRNLLESASVMADGDTLLPEHLPAEICGRLHSDSHSPPEEIQSLEAIEQAYLRRILQRYTGDRRELARRLGISERTLYRKLQQLSQQQSP